MVQFGILTVVLVVIQTADQRLRDLFQIMIFGIILGGEI